MIYSETWNMSATCTVSDKLRLWKMSLAASFLVFFYVRPCFFVCQTWCTNYVHTRGCTFATCGLFLSPLRVQRSLCFSGGCKSKLMKRLSWFWIPQQTTKMGYLLRLMEVDVGSRRCLFCPSPKVQVQGCSVCPESAISQCRCSH